MHLTRHVLSFTATATTTLPAYLGSSIRGKLGEVLHQQKPSLYKAFFEAEIPKDVSLEKTTINQAPAPYVLAPLKHTHTLQKGEQIDVIFTLIGKYIDHFYELLPIFNAMALSQWGAEKVAMQFTGYNQLICPISNEPLYQLKNYINLPPTEKPITLQLISPLSINSNKQIVTDFSYSRLIHFLHKRLYLLNTLYGNSTKLPNPEMEIIENVGLRNINVNRINVNRKGRNHEQQYAMKGWKGKLTYSGNYHNTFGFLLFGQHTHIGNNTTFGMGQYLVKY